MELKNYRNKKNIYLFFKKYINYLNNKLVVLKLLIISKRKKKK